MKTKFYYTIESREKPYKGSCPRWRLPYLDFRHRDLHPFQMSCKEVKIKDNKIIATKLGRRPKLLCVVKSLRSAKKVLKDYVYIYPGFVEHRITNVKA